MNYQNPYFQPNPYMNRTNGITWVQGMEGAKAYQLIPNSNIILMDSDNDGIFYIKVSDDVGMCSLRTFKFSEITNEQRTNQIDTSQFVTRAEFDNLVKQLGGVDNEQSLQPTQSTTK